MSDKPIWQWWWSTDEENYTGPYGSRDEAVEAATDDEAGFHKHEDGSETLAFFVQEAMQRPIDIAKRFDLTRWLDDFEDSLSEYSNADGDLLTEQIAPEYWAELETRIKDTIRRWQAEEDHKIIPWTFTDTRNRETVQITLKGPDPVGDGE